MHLGRLDWRGIMTEKSSAEAPQMNGPKELAQLVGYVAPYPSTPFGLGRWHIRSKTGEKKMEETVKASHLHPRQDGLQARARNLPIALSGPGGSVRTGG